MFSSASIEKGKKTSIGSYAQEQERVMGDGQDEWKNKKIDVNMPRAHAIRVVENAYGGSVKAAIEGRIATAGVKRKVRDNAVTHLTVYASMPDYSNRSEDERTQFVHLLKAFLEKKYGEKNVVDIRWHFDESTPHLHATVVPITQDGRLCAKELFAPTKKSMEKWQKEYYAQVAGPMHYTAPDFGHSSEKGYTKSTVATRQQLELVQGKKEAAEQELAAVEKAVEQVKARNRGLAEEGRELGERARDLEEEVEGLREHVSLLETRLRRVVAALRRVPAALEMAAQALPEGFLQAIKSFEDGLKAREPEPEPAPEQEWGLDEMMENYGEDDVYGGYRGSCTEQDIDL